MTSDDNTLALASALSMHSHAIPSVSSSSEKCCKSTNSLLL